MNALQTQTFKQEVEKFRKSNSFTPGDPTSFSIKLNDEVSLPGKYDPTGYLDGYGIETKGYVAIIHGANGGLAVEAIRRGAKSVLVYENRNQYFKALEGVNAFCLTALSRAFNISRFMPETTTKDADFDTIIWSEGMEQLPNPIQPIKAVLSRLAPSGKLYIEVIHGTNGPCPALIKSWKPKPESFEETIKAIPDVKIVGSKKGRKDLRTVYTIESTKPVVPQETAVAFKADPAGPLADAAVTPTVLTPKKAKNQPKPKQGPPSASPLAPGTEAAQPKPRRRRAAPKPPETPAGPTPTPV